MEQTIELRQISLSSPRQRRILEGLLSKCGLNADTLPPIYIGAFDADGRLVGGAGLDGNVIKCVAVDPDCRDLAITNSVVSRLLSIALSEGHSNVMVYTKPEHEVRFRSLSFSLVGRCPQAVLMESRRDAIGAYAQYLSQRRKPGCAAVAVMNCNPMTLGHRYLIEQGAKRFDHLFIIPVKEDRSEYTYAERRQMLEAETREMPNVEVLDGSDCVISAATFPSYFLKDQSAASVAHIALDCDIFARHIIPALGVVARIVGTEPSDGLTAAYNARMREHLPIEVVEIPRLEKDDAAVSASRVRRDIAEERLGQALRHCAPSARPFAMAHAAAWALVQELELTPKPGLVDQADNGSHRDMDLPLMRRSIDALRPYFAQIAQAGADAPALRAIGIAAEQAMMEATGGVNAHRGALFSMGLTLGAAAQCDNLTADQLQARISQIAAQLAQPDGTHGAAARKRHGIPGALQNAQQGYSQLFDSWLPYYCETHDPHRLLLKIMSELEDTNVVHRGGIEGAQWLKEQAAAVLADYSLDALKRLNQDCIARNLSPGGAADMLSLTLFIASLLS
ncbi:MAG: triphosphoribosyl-dephospho-CoA synthase [Bacteroidales bacterium]|nr:triphosphoribosyl-dephospho-CoA synthase [Bacteroidales bacterium]